MDLKRGREHSHPKQPGQAALGLVPCASRKEAESREMPGARPPPDDLGWHPGSYGSGGPAAFVLPPFEPLLRL